MEKEEPVKLYIILTMVVIILLTVGGLELKKLFGEKFQKEKDVTAEESKEEDLSGSAAISRSIFSVAFLIFTVAVVLFLLLKITTAKRKSNY
jgi:hypothetical protein